MHHLAVVFLFPIAFGLLVLGIGAALWKLLTSPRGTAVLVALREQYRHWVAAREAARQAEIVDERGQLVYHSTGAQVRMVLPGTDAIIDTQFVEIMEGTEFATVASEILRDVPGFVEIDEDQ